jgi:hypothetical protein
MVMHLNVADMMRMYDKLCDLADDLFATHDPCKINGNKCAGGKTCCARGIEHWNGPECQYLGENGCTTKSLACKLYVCATASKALPDKVKKLLYKYKAQALVIGIPIAHIRESREYVEDYLRRKYNEK